MGMTMSVLILLVVRHGNEASLKTELKRHRAYHMPG